MKKILIILAVIISILVINKEEKVIIPKESIRFRVIANSNTEEDQQLKKEIVKNLSTEIVEINNLNNITTTREYIKKELPTFEEIIKDTIENNSSDKEFNISYGYNYFPEKEYKNVIYKAGNYESLVVTLGDGKGENFWCVLFPPLCMIEENKENVEYTSLIKEIIEMYF